MRDAIESTFDKEIVLLRSQGRERNLGTKPIKIGTARCRIELTRKWLTDSSGLDLSINKIIVYIFNDLGVVEGDSVILPDEKVPREINDIESETIPGQSDIYTKLIL